MRVFFDENFTQHFIHALEILERPKREIEIYATIDIPELGKKATDDQIVEYIIKSGGGILITKDRDFKTHALLFDLISGSDVGLFIIKVDSIDYWSQLVYFFTKWNEIRKVLLKEGFSCSYTVAPRSGLRKMK